MSRIKDIRKSVDIKHMYDGLDLHKATINATVMDENGTVLNEVKIKKQLLKVDTNSSYVGKHKERAKRNSRQLLTPRRKREALKQ